MASAKQITREAAGAVDRLGLAGFVKSYGLGGIFLALTYAIINAITQFGATITAPFRALGRGLARLVEGTLFTSVDIVGASGTQTAYAITEGAWSFFGPLTFAVGVFAVMAGLYVLIEGIRRLELRPWRLYKGMRRR